MVSLKVMGILFKECDLFWNTNVMLKHTSKIFQRISQNYTFKKQLKVDILLKIRTLTCEPPARSDNEFSLSTNPSSGLPRQDIGSVCVCECV